MILNFSKDVFEYNISKAFTNQVKLNGRLMIKSQNWKKS